MIISQQLIKSCQAKDRKAQKELYDQMLPYLKAIATRYLRNNQYIFDVLQESFVTIFLSIKDYNVARGTFKSWASKIVINRSINFNDRIIGISHEDITDLEQSPEHIEESVLLSMSKVEMLDLIKSMPKGYFEVFNLYVIDGYDHEEIADILDINSALSRKKLSRAKGWLKKINLNKQVVILVLLLHTINII